MSQSKFSGQNEWYQVSEKYIEAKLNAFMSQKNIGMPKWTFRSFRKAFRGQNQHSKAEV